jgi:hypothetical protein
MYILTGLVILSGLFGTLSFFDKRTPLHNLIQIRGAFSGLRRSISREILDESNLLTIVSHTNHFHVVDPLVFSLFGFIYWFYIRPDIDKDSKIQDIHSFSEIERRMNIFTLVFMTLMLKNVENAV